MGIHEIARITYNEETQSVEFHLDGLTVGVGLGNAHYWRQVRGYLGDIRTVLILLRDEELKRTTES